MKGLRPDENLTGGQIQQILDKLLYDSIYLLAPFGILDQQLTTILSSLVLDKRRKISSADYDLSIDMLCRLVMGVEEDIFSTIKKLKLERTLYIKLISNFLMMVEEQDYPKFYSQWIRVSAKMANPTRRLQLKEAQLNQKLLEIEKHVKIDRLHLFMVYQNVKFNMVNFHQFKSTILSQFINLAHKYTSTQIKHKNKSLNYDDLFQNIVAAVSKAIDKYDSSKGALTSYIKYWIINAQNQNNSHIEGQAYEITYNQRQKVAKKETLDLNFSTSLSDAHRNSAVDYDSPETLVEDLDAKARITALIKHADPKSVFRLSSNIEEFLTDEERKMMRKLSLKAGILDAGQAETASLD